MTIDDVELEVAPMPKAAIRGSRGGATNKYTRAMCNMQVGSCFFVPPGEEGLHSVTGSMRYWGKKLGRKFVSRKTDRGLGVWRTE
jgi:hypothetical protein